MILSEKQKQRIKLSRALEFDATYPAPDGLEYRPFQKAGIYYAASLLEENKNVLIADPPGVGKTIQSIGALNLFNETSIRRLRTLVIVPASLLNNWKSELEKWLVDYRSSSPHSPIVDYLDSKSMRKGVKADVFIASYGMMSQKDIEVKVLNYFEFDFCILDEVHFLKNPKSNRTKAVLGRNGIARAARIGAIALTGTPIVNRPIEVYPALKSLCPVAIDNMTYFEYGLKYCAGFKDSRPAYGGGTAENWNFKGFSNMKELGARMRSRFMIRRKKSEVLCQLPSKTVATTYLSLDSKTKKIVARSSGFNEQLVANKKKFENFHFDEEAGDHLSTYRRELGIEKAPIAANYIKTQLESGMEKVVVFAHHKEVIEILNKCLQEFGVVEIVGKTSRDNRGLAVKLFQEDKSIRVFLGSLKAANLGLTLTAASDVRIVEPSWVPGDNEQAEDRVHRIGQSEHVLIEYLLFEDDLDDIVLKSQTVKQKGITKVVD